MLKCRPVSIWSWNFEISGSSTGPILTSLDRETGGGTIDHAGHRYAITKQKGRGLGQWTMKADATTYAEAMVMSVGISKIEFTTPAGVLKAKALPFNRTYDFFAQERQVGTVRPHHLLTRKSTIYFTGEVAELTQVFCFWVAAVHWYYGSQD
jgi:hypothetical protein